MWYYWVLVIVLAIVALASKKASSSTESFFSGCGAGVRSRTMVCKRSDGTIVTGTDTSKCGAVPASTETCQKTTGCQWDVGPWSRCSNTCGTGSQTRTVTCKTTDGNMAASDSLCTGTKPPTSQGCTDRTGCIYSWNVSDWTSCVCPSGSPYNGTRTRTVTCPQTPCDQNQPHSTERCACPGTWAWENVGGCECPNGQCSSAGWCKGQRQELRCPTGANCGPRPTEWVRYVDCRCTPPPPRAAWYTSDWSRCDCPSKTQSRTAYCPPGYDCGPMPSPLSRACPSDIVLRDCPIAYNAWQYDEWGACDCNTKKQTRRVYCPLGNCDPNAIPASSRDADCATRCALPPPGQWTATAWSKCDCTTNTQRRTYYCPAGTACAGTQPPMEERLGECPVVCYVSNNGITNTSDPRCTDPNKKVDPVGDWLMSQWSACKELCATEPGVQTRAVCKTGTGAQPATRRGPTLNCQTECASR
jgi:hypothetical protein